MTPEMTGKERWIAAIKMEPIDHFLFWPKFSRVYSRFQKGTQFGDMTTTEIMAWTGADADGWLPEITKEIRTHTDLTIKTDNQEKEIVFTTKYGTCKASYSLDEKTNSWHPTAYPIKTVEDIKIMTEWYRDIKHEIDRDILQEAVEKTAWYGDSTIVTTTVGGLKSESPLMHFMEWLAGIVEGQFLIADYPDEVEELFHVMHQELKQRVRIHAAHSPAELVGLSENTSTTIISPTQYANYNIDHINEYGRIVHEHGKLFQLHMCGHIKNLLPQLATVEADSFEALTPPTVGDTDFVTARAACPNMNLIGGTNATMWVSTPEEVIAYLDDQFAQLPHHRGIVPSSGGELPPICPPAFVKQVCDFVKNYKVRN